MFGSFFSFFFFFTALLAGTQFYETNILFFYCVVSEVEEISFFRQNSTPAGDGF